MDLAPWRAVGGDRQPFPPAGRGRRVQPQVRLLGVDLQHFPPEQADEPVGQALQRGVVHAWLDLAQVVHEQVADTGAGDSVAVHQRLDCVLTGVALGRPGGAERGRLVAERAERHHQLPGEVFASMPAGGPHHVGVVQHMVALELVQPATGADQHPRQAGFGVISVPQQRALIRRQPPQTGQVGRLVHGQHPARQTDAGLAVELPAIRGRSTRATINAFAPIAIS